MEGKNWPETIHARGGVVEKKKGLDLGGKRGRNRRRRCIPKAIEEKMGKIGRLVMALPADVILISENELCYHYEEDRRWARTGRREIWKMIAMTFGEVGEGFTCVRFRGYHRLVSNVDRSVTQFSRHNFYSAYGVSTRNSATSAPNVGRSREK